MGKNDVVYKALQEVACLPINKKVYTSIATLGANKTILSIGCNIALLEKLLKKKGNKVYGIDIDKEAVATARQCIDGAYCLDIQKIKTLPFQKEYFDIILFADVLEHLKDPSAILKFVKQYLNKEGYLVVSLPNIANWSIRLKLLFGSFRYTDGGILDKSHIHFYTLSAAKKLLSTAGYKIIDKEYNPSVVNILYAVYKKRRDGSHTLLTKEKKISTKWKSLIRKICKTIIESCDELFTNVFPTLFAYQFIFVAKKALGTKEPITKQ